MDAFLRFTAFKNSPRLSKEEREELNSLSEEEIEFRFSKDLSFGTAGMRGILGCGTNMMNVYTVMRATKGLSDFLCAEFENPSVVISYDTRRNSKLFATKAASVLAKSKIKVYLFDMVHPVPMLSFAVRELRSSAGIMITASHNPKEYNGYKVYGSDGAQLSPEATERVFSAMEKYDPLSIEGDEGSENILSVPAFVDERYFNALESLSLSKEATKKFGEKLKLVYTPVHGSGYRYVIEILKRIGILPIVVEEQIKEDPDFSTVKVPNPEFKETLEMGISLAEKVGAGVVFGTDPDSDRLGVAVRNEEGKFVSLSGNQIGILLLDYLLTRKRAEGKLLKNAAVVCSFVSTALTKYLCKDAGVALFEVPVGFKFIGEKIKEWEKSGEYSFLFGFEESCGYLCGTHARDKDAVCASMLFAEMVCYLESAGESVFSRLNKLYEKYGYTLDQTKAQAYAGIDGMEKMNSFVEALRNASFSSLGGLPIVEKRDYLLGVKETIKGKEPISKAFGNCLFYEFSDGSFLCVRPSGTEPKLKFYESIRGETFAICSKKRERIEEELNRKIKTNI